MVVKNCGLNYGIRIRKKNSPKQIQDEGFKVDLNNSRYKFIFARNQRVVMFTSKQKLHQPWRMVVVALNFNPWWQNMLKSNWCSFSE